MSTEYDPKPKCIRCNAELTDAAGGLCPRCLMAEAMKPTQLDGTGAAPPLTPEELAPHFPQFEILSCLGRGGMGVVYKARQKSLDRLVALKLLAPERETDAEFAERFAHEARALAALSHPNIVTVHEFGRADGLYFLVMEFVDGVNLRQAMKAGRFTPEQALAIVPPVCEALQFAHEHGIVHRDIKPENLLLDKSGRVKIADFGIAKILGAESRAGLAASQPAGTPQYMAPEQREHQHTDHRADIYSLGVVLYELLTGELPAENLQPPSQKVQIDVRLDGVVLRALSEKPELRYQTATEFRTLVETLAAQSAAPPSTGWEPPAIGWGSFIGTIFGVKFTSRRAWQLANLSALGFLSFLGFVPLPGWQRCFGFAGFFGLIGLAHIAEFWSRGSRAARMIATAGLAFAIAVIASMWGVRWLGTAAAGRKPAGASGFSDPAVAAQNAWKLWQNGRPAEALPLFREMVKRTAGDANTWNGLGWSAFNSGRIDEARQAFEKVLALDPSHIGALNGAGQIFLAQRDYGRAEAPLLKAAEQGASASWYGLARLYLLAGKFSDAEKWTQRLVESGQGDAIAEKMLEAAKARTLSEGLRATIEPPAPKP